MNFKESIYSDSWDKDDSALVSELQGPILIIGASGFIGSNLAFSLLKRRDDVFLASPSVGNSWRLNSMPYKRLWPFSFTIDITKPESVYSVLYQIKPRTVFNLSAYGAYERQSEAKRIHEVNYMGSLHLLETLRKMGCEAFVQAGSSSEYGLNCTQPKEDGILQPNSDYAVSKGATSLLIRYYGEVLGFPCAHLRLYSVYGPWEDRDRLIPRVVQSGLRGTYPPFVNPKISRDFIYVDDCTRAFLYAAAKGCRSKPGETWNIASGIATTLEQVAECSQRIFSIAEAPSFGTMVNRKWDLSNWFGNSFRANSELQWFHRISLEQGLRMTTEWEINASDKIKFSTIYKATAKKLSVVIACYKDHQAIPVMYERLKKTLSSSGYNYEIIFVNDGSPANDERAIMELTQKDTHVMGISHSRNFGSQAAFLSGMEIASGEGVVIMDGDLQDPPELILEFLKKWEEGYEVVYGERIKRDASLIMQILYKAFYRIFSALADIKIPLDAGDFSLLDRKIVTKLINMPEKDIFLRGLRAWLGFRQIGVPYVRPERMFGRSTNNFLKNIWWAKKAIFSFSQKPLEYVQRLGIVMFLVSFLLGIFYLTHHFLNPSDSKGVTTIVLLVLSLSGVQLFCLGLFGDYLGKVLEEVKNRPRFVRSKLFINDSVIKTEEEIKDFIINLKIP